jgi:hypothetical protein
MRSPIRTASAIALALAAGSAVTVLAQRGTPPTAPAAVSSPADTTSRIVASAQAVLAALDDAGRAKVQFRFDDVMQKTRWSNLPTGIFRREGLRLSSSGRRGPRQRGTRWRHLGPGLR